MRQLVENYPCLDDPVIALRRGLDEDTDTVLELSSDSDSESHPFVPWY